MAIITLTELNALLNDLAMQKVEDATINLRSFLSFVPVNQALINNGQPPMAVVISDEGYTDNGTHARGGAYNAADAPTYQQPRHPDWGRYDRSIKYSHQDLTTLGMAGDTALINRVAEDMENARRTLEAEFSADLLTNDPEGAGDANGASGLSHAVSASNTYMGVNRGASTYFDAYVNAVGGAVTTAVLDTMIETLEDTRGGRVDFLLASTKQAKAISNLTFAAAATYNVDIAGTSITPIVGVRSDPGPQGTAGFSSKPFTFYQGKPVFAVAGMADTLCYALAMGGDGFQMAFQQAPMWSPFTDVQGTSSATATLVWRAQSVLRNPYKHAGVLTGLT
jgi:hypothetical protein